MRRPCGVADRHHRDLLLRLLGALVAVLAEEAGQVKGREALGVGRHLAAPAAHAGGVQGARHRLLPPLVLGRDAGSRSPRVEHARLVRLPDERRRCDAARARARSRGPRSGPSSPGRRPRCGRARRGRPGRRARGCRPRTPWRRACPPARGRHRAGRARCARCARRASALAATSVMSRWRGVFSIQRVLPARRAWRTVRDSSIAASDGGRAAK